MSFHNKSAQLCKAQQLRRVEHALFVRAALYTACISGRGDMFIFLKHTKSFSCTGSGKTLLAKTLGQVAGVPYAMAYVTTLTHAGHADKDMANVLYQTSFVNRSLYAVQA